MRQLCCHVGCNEVATKMIVGKMGVGYDDTYMCATHEPEYVTQEDTSYDYKQEEIIL